MVCELERDASTPRFPGRRGECVRGEVAVAREFERKDVVVTVVGTLLGLAVLGAIFAGAVGYDDDDESLVFGANLALGVLAYAFVALIAYADAEWRFWTIRRAVGFMLAGSGFTVTAFAAPWTTGWLFALIAELI
jgi:hypothetical protein